MQFAHRIRLEVDAQTERILDGQSKICNWEYNQLVEIANRLRDEYIKTQDSEVAKTLYTQRGLRNLVPDLKEEHPFLRTVHSSPLKNVALRLARAIKAYQDCLHKRREGPKMEWPRFRAWGKKWFSLEYDEPHKGFKLSGMDLTIVLGQDEQGQQLKALVRLSQPLPKGGEVQALRIIKQAGQFFAVFSMTKPDRPGPVLLQVAERVAEDVVLPTLAARAGAEPVMTVADPLVAQDDQPLVFYVQPAEQPLVATEAADVSEPDTAQPAWFWPIQPRLVVIDPNSKNLGMSMPDSDLTPNPPVLFYVLPAQPTLIPADSSTTPDLASSELRPVWPIQPRVVAIDPNQKNFGVGVSDDGVAFEISRPNWLKGQDRRIDILKSRRDRCVRKSRQVTRPDGSYYWLPSRRWQFFNLRLNQAYQVRRDQTKTYLFTLANKLCKDFDVIAVGDYTPRGGGLNKGMRRSMNNQSLIGRFKKTMDWVARKSGKVYTEYDETGTTRTCYQCGYVVKGGIPLDVRAWTCPNPDCRAEHLRDENAAQNGLRLVIHENSLMPRSASR